MSEKILVIQTAFLGDAVLTLPMIQKLSLKFNNSLIDVLCIPSTESIFKSSPYTNDIIVFDKRNKDKSLFSLAKFSKQFRNNKYSRVYSPHRSARTSLLILISGIKNSFGFNNSSLKWIYKNLINYDNNGHEVKRNLDLIGSDTKDNWQVLPEVKIDNGIKKKIDDTVKRYDLNKIIAVAPGSVWNTKIYPSEYYEKVINYFVDKNYNVFLIGGESDKKLCENISINFGKSVFNTAGMFTPVESIELLKRCNLLISNDSAPTHLGMCADIPVLTIYCSTVKSFGFYPYNSKSSSLSYDELECKPCGIHGYKNCPLGHFNCGKLLEPGRVIKKAEELVNHSDKKL